MYLEDEWRQFLVNVIGNYTGLTRIEMLYEYFMFKFRVKMIAFSLPGSHCSGGSRGGYRKLMIPIRRAYAYFRIKDFCEI